MRRRASWSVVLIAAAAASVAATAPAIGAARLPGFAWYWASGPRHGPAPAGSVSAGDAASEPGPTVRAPGSDPRLCKKFEWKWVHWFRNWYAIRNDNFADKECINNVHDGPNYIVSNSTAHSRTHDNQAFPHIFDGCAWGICTPGTALPYPWAKLRHVYATVYTYQHAPGLWNSAFDIWFGRHPHKTGQARGTELMIWLGTGGDSSGRAPVVVINNARWSLHHWRACNTLGCWNYILFWRVQITHYVQHFDLVPFFRYASRQGTAHTIGKKPAAALSKSWYLWNIEYGNEIWRGGNGLGVSFFRIQGLPTRPFVPPKG